MLSRPKSAPPTPFSTPPTPHQLSPHGIIDGLRPNWLDARTSAYVSPFSPVVYSCVPCLPLLLVDVSVASSPAIP